jgi:hypothetical protein
MGIIRIKHTANFLIMDKKALQDVRMSWRAKGLLAYLLSLPNDWTIYTTELQKRSTDGRRSMTAAINELKQKGYIIYRKTSKGRGKITHEYVVFEKPHLRK